MTAGLFPISYILQRDLSFIRKKEKHTVNKFKDLLLHQFTKPGKKCSLIKSQLSFIKIKIKILERLFLYVSSKNRALQQNNQDQNSADQSSGSLAFIPVTKYIL